MQADALNCMFLVMTYMYIMCSAQIKVPILSFASCELCILGEMLTKICYSFRDKYNTLINPFVPSVLWAMFLEYVNMYSTARAIYCSFKSNNSLLVLLLTFLALYNVLFRSQDY